MKNHKNPLEGMQDFKRAIIKHLLYDEIFSLENPDKINLNLLWFKYLDDYSYENNGTLIKILDTLDMTIEKLLEKTIRVTATEAKSLRLPPEDDIIPAKIIFNRLGHLSLKYIKEFHNELYNKIVKN